MQAVDGANPPSTYRAAVRLGDPLYYIFTSGTTGLPKAALMSHLRFLNAGGVIAGLLDLTRADVLYNVLPLYHGAGGMVVVSAALHVGIPIVLKRRFSASEFWDDVRRHGVTAWYYIGEICRYLLNQPARPDDRDHPLRRMSGAGLKAQVWRQFQERFGIELICEGLGSTEANYGLTNVDNRVGSVGRLPYPERSNIRVVRYDVERGDYLRSPGGALVLCKPGEVGELIAEVLDGPGAAGFFEGYTSAEATQAKLLRDVFRPGDRWMRSGDLVRFDADDYFYFVDRVGDTYRWKSENVSTDEVAAVLGQFPGPAVANVYGVRVPGTEGRAGMVALTYADPRQFDPAAFHAFAAARLADYAVPVFVRISADADLTTTFKLRKIDLQRAGYDPGRTPDPLFVRDARAARYVPLTTAALAGLGLAALRRETGRCGSNTHPSSSGCARSSALILREAHDAADARGHTQPRERHGVPGRTAAHGPRWLADARLAKRVWRARPGSAGSEDYPRGAVARRGAIPLRHRQYHWSGAASVAVLKNKSVTSCRASPAVNSISPSATPSRRPAPTSRRCARRRCAPGTSLSSMGRKSLPAGPRAPTTSGWRCAPMPPRPRIAGFRS